MDGRGRHEGRTRSGVEPSALHAGVLVASPGGQPARGRRGAARSPAAPRRGPTGARQSPWRAACPPPRRCPRQWRPHGRRGPRPRRWPAARAAGGEWVESASKEEGGAGRRRCRGLHSSPWPPAACAATAPCRARRGAPPSRGPCAWSPPPRSWPWWGGRAAAREGARAGGLGLMQVCEGWRRTLATQQAALGPVQRAGEQSQGAAVPAGHPLDAGLLAGVRGVDVGLVRGVACVLGCACGAGRGGAVSWRWL
jgi:hypothetical protein